jgi:predicted RNase H-like HicB family nuclease
MTELLFIVTEDSDGGFNARASGHEIFTQADTREELVANARDAVRCHFGSAEAMPKMIHMHYVHDEVVAL